MPVDFFAETECTRHPLSRNPTSHEQEEDPPENAITVFLSPVEGEVRTQVYMTGGLVAMVNFARSITGYPPRVFQLGGEKMAVITVDHYSLVRPPNPPTPHHTRTDRHTPPPPPPSPPSNLGGILPPLLHTRVRMSSDVRPLAQGAVPVTAVCRAP